VNISETPHGTARVSLRRQSVLLAVFLAVFAPSEDTPFFSPQGLYAQEADGVAGEADGVTGEADGAAGEQEAGAETEAEPEEELTEEELEALREKEEADRIVSLEINTSTMIELAEWCRELELSDGGSRDDLANRLRDHFGLPRPDGSVAANQKIVTIESAKTTEYFTLEAVNEEYARFSGGVVLGLTDGEARHRVKAWEIIYNRTRNILSATGNVEYVKEEGDKKETFRGDEITINLDTWLGSFIDTISERAIAGSDTAYRFAGQVISQTDTETTVLKKARITNAKTDEPLWSLDAGKLWILPGSDWALSSGVLRVGEIPVLWVPFFFFSADEMVIHPVLGTRTREGTFAQTTTYILGRPDSSAIKQNSISQILGSGEGMEQVREGLFLRTTGRKDTKADARRLSIIVDAYTNLGFYTGTEISLPKLWLINNFKFSGGLAFTRTVFKAGTTTYVPYNVNGDFEQNWDKGYIFGQEVPFRYRLTTTPSISGKYGSVSFAFHSYSDPFVDYDVLNRSESIDWMEMLRQGAATQIEPDTNSNTSRGQFEWNLTAKPQFSTAFLAPYISSLTINNISSVYHFAIGTNAKVRNEYPESPQREFYYPDKFTMYSISAGVSGTPFTWSSATSVAEKDKEIPDPVKKFGTLRSPWEEDALKSGSSGASIQKPFSLDVPALNQTFNIAPNSGLKIAWNYNLRPTSASELNYSTSDWTSPDEIDLSDIKSILMRVNTDGDTAINITDPNNNLFSFSGGVTGSMQWQEHTYINEEAPEYNTEDKINADKLADYRATVWNTAWKHNTTINPLYWSPAWKATNVQYTINGLLARSNFIGTGDEPDWEIIYGEWTKEKITAHNMAANLGVNVLDKAQSLHLQTELPPRDSSLSMNSTVNAWISTTSVATKINEPFEGDPKYQQVTFNETLTFKSGYTFNQNMIYDPSYYDWQSMASTLTLGKFNARYTSSRGPGYELSYDSAGNINGWKARPGNEEKLRPVSLYFGFSQSFKKENLLNKTLSFSVDPNISLSLDLQRYTYSSLSFSLNFTFNVTKFLSLTAGTTSENREMFRYLRFLPFFNEFSSEIPKSPTKNDNFFEDLINSFRFDDEELRRNSGFKLKAFKFSATHHLGDWDAKLTVDMAPWRRADSNVFEFDTQISFLVQWLPISELKTEIAYNGKETENKFSTK
jgi:lipopolysaccharide assembly outer membrane protein LptD (OstA)